MTRVLLISSGTGPLEARRFVLLLVKRMRLVCARAGIRIVGITLYGEPTAPKSAHLAVNGDATTMLAAEEGTHVLVTKSLRRHGRKRWFVGVSVIEDRHEKIPGLLNDNDLRTTVCPARGPGGQHVNRAATAVRMSHIPTGLTVRVETERSQYVNRTIARRRIHELLVSQARIRQVQHGREVRGSHYRVVRGAPVRAYVLTNNGELEEVNER